MFFGALALYLSYTSAEDPVCDPETKYCAKILTSNGREKISY